MGVFDLKTVEMIALSASVAAGCIPCTQHHLVQAEKKGLTKKEIKEIIRIAKMVKQRPINEIEEITDAYLGTKKQAGCAKSDCRSLSGV